MNFFYFLKQQEEELIHAIGEDNWENEKLYFVNEIVDFVEKWEDFLEKNGVLSRCSHVIIDARNEVIQSGYICTKCGKLFNSGDHQLKK